MKYVVLTEKLVAEKGRVKITRSQCMLLKIHLNDPGEKLLYTKPNYKQSEVERRSELVDENKQLQMAVCIVLSLNKQP